MTSIYKELINNLRIKVESVSHGTVPDIANRREFALHSPFIDEKGKEMFCNDAYNISWQLNKAHYLLK